MRRFVFWTGMMSVSVGLGLQFPALAVHLMPSAAPGMLMRLCSLMVVFAGLTLVLCSRDLKRRGALVLWEGLLRVGVAVVMGVYGLSRPGGLQLATAGLGDLIIAVGYFVWLPRHLQVSLVDLLLDRPIHG